MSLYDDIAQAELLVAARQAGVVEVEKSLEGAKSLLTLARSHLNDLEASAVKGGPDVSNYQGEVDWGKVRSAGYDLVFPKVSDGDLVDPRFTSARVNAIKAAGLSYIPYHYARVASPGNQYRNGRLEAALAVSNAAKAGWGRKGDLPLAYDFEDLNGQSKEVAQIHLLEFIRAYRGLMGHYPVLYTFLYFWNSLTFSDADKTVIDNCPLWIANWEVSRPTVPSPWPTWTFWQFSDKATIPGIAAPCDNNRVNLTRDQLDALRIK